MEILLADDEESEDGSSDDCVQSVMSRREAGQLSSRASSSGSFVSCTGVVGVEREVFSICRSFVGVSCAEGERHAGYGGDRWSLAPLAWPAHCLSTTTDWTSEGSEGLASWIPPLRSSMQQPTPASCEEGRW